MPRSQLAAFALLVSCGLTAVAGQADSDADPAPKPTTRVEQIQAEREAKARQLEPEVPGETEQLVDRVIHAGFLSQPSGFGVKLGGMIPGAGFALGPRYFRPDLLNERMQLDLSAVGSINRYYSLEGSVAFPRLAAKRLDALFTVRRNDYPSIRYFGPGPRTSRDAVSNFRREDNFFSSRLGWRPVRRHVLVGAETSFLRQNIGPGVSGHSPSTDSVFGFTDAPGLEAHPRYFISGPFALLDHRDHPGNPRSGGAYRLRYLNYADLGDQRFSFRRLEAQTEHYIPFWNDKRVIAIYGRALLSYTDPGRQVPFYMQPTMGGPNDLRGVSQFRYQDNNAVMATAEYRWEVSTGFEMALFADGGNVFPRPGMIGLRNMQAGGGLGLRFKTRESLALRLDLGASREGFRIWISTANVFSPMR